MYMCGNEVNKALEMHTKLARVEFFCFFFYPGVNDSLPSGSLVGQVQVGSYVVPAMIALIRHVWIISTLCQFELLVHVALCTCLYKDLGSFRQSHYKAL